MGVEKEILKPGNGVKPRKGQKITVHCTGFLADVSASLSHHTPSSPHHSTSTTHLTSCCLSLPLPLSLCAQGKKKFWSTQDPGQKPFAFEVGQGQVIRGWDEGFINMAQGEKARLTMTGDYACQQLSEANTAVDCHGCSC